MRGLTSERSSRRPPAAAGGRPRLLDAPPDLEDASAEEVLEFAVERFQPKLFVACSFQKEASVIMDMLVRIDPTVHFFTLDTGVLFPETYETWERVERHYGIEIERRSGISLQDQSKRYGARLWEDDPDLCCDLRKVTPLRDRLRDADAWVTGLRRDQSSSRATTEKIGWDKRHGLWKVSPLADWTEAQVWSYIMANDVPYHPLHDRGYQSIGCTHCTRPSAGRHGRWAGTDKIECGLHSE
jgi:phosphoadenosine phosphosulfate reductase